MYNVEITSVISHIRIFNEGESYEERDPYIGILTLQYLTDEVVYICGAHGVEMNREIYNLCVKALKKQGVTSMVYERHGKIKQKDI